MALNHKRETARRSERDCCDKWLLRRYSTASSRPQTQPQALWLASLAVLVALGGCGSEDTQVAGPVSLADTAIVDVSVVDSTTSDTSATDAASGDVQAGDVTPSGDAGGDTAADTAGCVKTGEEACNGLDDDCDGETDEETCADDEPCTEDKCDGKACSNPPSTAPCEADDNACTQDVCAGGSCTPGGPKDCDDNNPCTNDTCDKNSGACGHAAVADGKTCDDGNACTSTDSCSKGACVGAVSTCDDKNPCTNDTCDKASGCKSSPTAGPCEDGSKCTSNDQCDDKTGTCTGGSAKDCDDKNTCTKDSCAPLSGTCVHSAVDGGACDDGNLCTTKETCSSGKCGGVVLPCNDGNPCTNDTCLGAKGCVYTPVGAPCDDGNACTDFDICAGGTCAGKPKEKALCDDLNPCTTDACSPLSGCVNLPTTATCTDGDSCTANGCKAGKCVTTNFVCGCATDKDCGPDDGNPCNGEQYCDKTQAVGVCKVKPSSVVVCDNSDDGLCQETICNPKTGKCAAQTKNEGKACDADGSICTSGDACKSGKCTAGQAAKCDDNNPCTTDSCDAKAGCAYVANQGACDADGDACTIGDGCKDKLCLKGAVKPCDDNNPCTVDTCDSKTGACVFSAKSTDGKACDADGSFCTSNDACKAGKCAPGAALPCDDANPCTDDGCLAKTGCVHVANAKSCDADGDPCTEGDTCSGKACVAGPKKACDDGQKCTSDSCEAKTGKCLHNVIVGCGGFCKVDAHCDDSNTCTSDACVASKCLWKPIVAACDDGNACTSKDGCDKGVCAGLKTPCGDGNPCTNDGCLPSSGCVYLNNTAPCDDFDGCSLADVCKGGKCTAGTTKQCDDGDKCTNDACNPGDGKCIFKGIPGCGGYCAVATDCDDKNTCTDEKCDKGKCVSTVNTKPCDDGSQCTSGDNCANGKCVSGKAKVCDDGDPCTVDGCNPVNAACTVTDGKEGLACDDGNACTLKDTCGKGASGLTCKGSANTCDDGNSCTKDVCDPTAGACSSSPVAGPCQDGDPCTAGDTCSAGKCVAGVGVFVSTLAGSKGGFADGKGAAAQFNKPYGVAVDGDTAIVADASNHRIRRVTQDGTTTTLAGSGKSGLLNAKGKAAWFNAPYGVAVGSGGVVYVADRNNHAIRKIAADGTTTTLSGDGIYGSTNGKTSVARFRYPYAIAVAGDGSTLYVADTYNHRIRKISNGSVSTFAGSSYGFVNATGTAARFRYPIGVAVDGAGMVYVSDQSNHRIRRITPTGVVSTFAGSGSAGFLNGSASSARFYNPWGIAVDRAGVVYIGDRSTQRIRRIANGVVTSFAGGSAGWIDGKAGIARFYNPTGVALSSRGVVFVADSINNRVRRIEDASKPCFLEGACWANGTLSPKSPCQSCNADVSKTKWTVTKDGATCQDAALCTSSETCSSGQCVGKANDCADKDPCTLDSCDKGSGACVQAPIVGCGGNCKADKDCNDKNPCTTDSCTNNKCAFTPNTLACDDGDPCTWGDVCALGACVSGDRTEVSTIAGSTVGFTDATGTNAKFRYPRGVAIDTNGGVVVADGHNHRIRRIDAKGAVKTIAGSSAGFINATGGAARFYYPSDLTVHSSGVIYVADTSNNRIRRIDTKASVTTFAGSSSGFADGKGAAARFKGPSGVAVTKGGVVWVSDSSNHRIRRIQPDGTVITVAGSKAGFLNGQGISAQFNYPLGIAVMGNGSVAIADHNNNRIRRVTPDGVVSVIAGTGAAAYLDGPAAKAHFNRPWGLAAGSDGRIYVADRYNYRVRVISADGLVSRLAGTGSASFTDGDGLTEARFRNMLGIAVTSTGDVIVSDYDNHRIRHIRASAGACNVGGVCYTAGTRKAGAPCQACDAAQTKKAWSPVADGGTCDDGAFCTAGDVCASGKCGGKAKDCDDKNKCSADSCDANSGACSYKAIAGCDGWCVSDADCEDGNPCVTDTCIGAKINADGSQKPGSCKHTNNLILCEDGNSCTEGDRCKDGKCQAGAATWVTTLAGSAAGYVDGDAKTARFNQPHGLDVTATGVVWVADRYNHRVRKIEAGKVSLVAGGKAGYANGAPTIARFNDPTDVAFSDKLTYVCDRGNHRIRTIDAKGNVGVLAGSIAGFANGKGTAARFNNPYGLDASKDGVVYVADYSNHRVRRVMPDGTVTTLVGTSSGYVNGPATVARLSTPISVALLPNGNVVAVEHAGHRLRLITPEGTASLLAGSGKAGNANGKGAVAQFYYPRDVARHPSGFLVVADQNNHRLRKVSMDGAVKDFAGSSSGWVDGDAVGARLSSPRGVAVGVDGTVYVGDAGNHRVRTVRETSLPCKVAGRCWSNGSFDPKAPCKRCDGAKNPSALSAVADGSPCDDGGACTINATCNGGGCSGVEKSCDDKKACTADACEKVTGACIHTPIIGCDGYCTKDADCDDGNPCTLGASCQNNKCAQDSGTYVDTLAGAGKGYVNGPGKSAKFNNARGLDIDAQGRVWVADMSNHRIRRIAKDGTVSTVAGSGKAGLVDGIGDKAWFNGPSALAVDVTGTVWIADRYTHSIRKLDAQGEVTTVAGSGAAGYNDDFGKKARFNQPSGIAVSKLGMLYVADTYNHRIRRVEPDGTVHTVSGLSIGFADGDSAKAKFRYPTGITLGSDGNLFVADYGNHRVRRVNADGEVITIAGSGASGGLNGTAANAQFSYPWGIASDAAGRIFVVDRSGHRLRMIAGGLVQRVAGVSVGYVDGNASVARFYYPSALALAPSGTLYMADDALGRVRRVRMTTGACHIGGVCITTGSRNPLSACQSCQSKKAVKAWSAAATGAFCDDESACTQGDMCKANGCVGGTEKLCDDNNKCTLDVCNKDTGACEFKPTFDPNCKP